MRNEESRLQKAVVKVLRLNGFVVFANANGGYRRPIEAAILKAMGVMAGVPDLTVLLPNGHALWIELKTPDNKSKLSPAQKAWHEQAELFGHAVVTCRSVEEACDEAQKAWAYAFSKEWLVTNEEEERLRASRPLFLLFAGTSVDGTGQSHYIGRTDDKKSAKCHYDKCAKNFHLTGGVMILTNDALEWANWETDWSKY